MKIKLLHRLTCLLSSSLIVLQLAPLARAIPGNMSDGTGSVPGNMSDGTGINIVQLQQLLLAIREGRVLIVNGILISAEVQQTLLALLNGNPAGIAQLVTVLIQGGIPANLALTFSQSFIGLFNADGTVNTAQLQQLILAYRSIINYQGINLVLLNSLPEFLGIQAILAQLGIQVSIPTIGFYILPVGTDLAFARLFSQILLLRQGQSITINGIEISGELRALILGLLDGNQAGIGQFVSLLVQGGVPGNLAAQLAQSFRGLFNSDGTINQAQLEILIRSYRAVVTYRGINIAFLNNLTEFLAIQAILASLGIEVDISVIIGNQSDATNPLVVSLPLGTEPGKQDDQQAQDDNPEAPKPEIVEGEPGDDEVILIAEPLEAPLEATSDPVVTEELAQNEEPTVSSEPVADENISSSNPSEVNNTSVNETASSGASGDDSGVSGGEAVANGAFVTTSDIAGGFVFINLVIQIAVKRAAGLMLSQFKGEGPITIAGRPVSAQAQLTVKSLLTSNNGDALEAFISSLSSGGVPDNYAQALGITIQNMIDLDVNGEVTSVNATKFVTSVAVYNATIKASEVQVLTNTPGELTAVGGCLKGITQAATEASNGKVADADSQEVPTTESEAAPVPAEPAVAPQ